MIERSRILITLIALLSVISCTTEEVIFDIDQQFAEDIATIDQFLVVNNIAAETSESGVRYRIKEEGALVIPQSSCSLTIRMTVHYLDSSYVLSNYPELEEENGFKIPFDEEFPVQKCLGTNRLEGLYVLDELVGIGGKVQFFVPSRLGWGSAGEFLVARSLSIRGRFISIPANSNLLITAELIEVL